MYSLIMPACEIPDGWSVRKPNGSNRYNLHKKLKLHGDNGVKTTEVDLGEGTYFLVGSSVSCVPAWRQLAVDFSDLEDLEQSIDLLREMKDAERIGDSDSAGSS